MGSNIKRMIWKSARWEQWTLIEDRLSGTINLISSNVIIKKKRVEKKKENDFTRNEYVTLT